MVPHPARTLQVRESKEIPILKGKTFFKRPMLWHCPIMGNQGGEPSSIIMEGD